MKRLAFVGLTVLLAGALLPPVGRAQPVTETLSFSEECLDLDTGTIEDACYDVLEDQEWDLLVTYNSERAVHAVVFQNRVNDLEIAHLENTAFEDVTSDDVDSASFTKDVVDEAFAAKQSGSTDADLAMLLKSKGYATVNDFQRATD